MKLYKEIERCFPLIEGHLCEKELRCFLDCPYEELARYHFGLGTWIRNQLLPVDGALYCAFLKSGVVQKDDMSGWVIRGFYMHMHQSQ